MITRWFVLLSPLLLALACTGSTPSFSVPDNALHGTVTDAENNPLPGAFVTARAPENLKEITAITDAAGRYVITGLSPATYQVEARQVGFEASAEQTYSHQTGNAVALDFGLHRADDPYDQYPSSQFLAVLPEGETKRQFILDCTGCHQFKQRLVAPDGHPRSQDQWKQDIDYMLSFASASSNFPIMSPSRNAEETAAWLVAHLGTSDDPRPPASPPAPMTAKAADVVIHEYPIPAVRDLPHDLMPDTDGNVVITGMMTHQMYVLDPTTGTYATTAIPTAFANPRALALGPEGDWWVLLGNPRKIAHYTPETDTWQDYDVGIYPHSIVLDGSRVWFNGHFTKQPELIGYLDTQTGDVKTYEVPVEPMPDGGSTIPYGLRMGPDGTLWATQLVGGRLIRFEPDTETFTLYPLPTPYSGPRRPDIGADGIVWIPEYANNRLARFDPQTETFEEYELPIPDALPYIVRVHPTTGWVWIATAAADAVLRFNPETEEFVVYRLPTQSALIRHMEIDAETGAVWVAYGNSPAVTPKVARLELR